MIYTELTKKAMKLCFDAHQHQVDKSGIPYVFHPMIVAERMTSELTTTVALLHDVVEDTDYTLEDLRVMGYPEDVISALSLLTHAPFVLYMDYVKEIAKNPIAREVKLGDLRHNSDIARLSKVTEKDLARVEKYRKAIEYLESVAWQATK